MLKTIRVTQERIDEGKPNCSQFCPVALAIGEHVKCGGKIRVGYRDVTFGDQDVMFGDQYHMVKLPPLARQFIWTLDTCRDYPARPFEFELEIPDQFLKAPAGWESVGPVAD